MHFTVLSAMPLPLDISAAASAVPIDDVTNFVARKLTLKSMSEGKPMTSLEISPEMILSERWECLVESMAASLLAPYNENTMDLAYMEFDDQTEEGRAIYEHGGIDCVKTPDGRIIPCHSREFSGRYELFEGKVYRQRFGPLQHRKQTKRSKKYLALPNYPMQKLCPTLERFMTDYWGCVAEEGTGRYGYYSNPNGEWDWWQIGGRWPFRFLVTDDCDVAVTGEPSCLFKNPPEHDAPEGYRWVAGARKRDIAWDVMREFIRNQCAEQFHQCEEWFKAGKIPQEHAGVIRLVPDGILSWRNYLYREGEDLEQHLYSLGLSDQHLYPINTFAYVDADGWNDKSWETSDSDEKACQAWFKAVAGFIDKQPDDTLLVSVDCHT